MPCDLLIVRTQVHITNPTTITGAIEFELSTSKPPIYAQLFQTLPTASAVFSTYVQNGVTIFPFLAEGTYRFDFTDAAGCPASFVFTIGLSPTPGCTNPLALNYNAAADQDDGSCVLPIPTVPGCTNPRATNYDPNANQDNGSCVFGPADLGYTYTDGCLTLVYNEPEQKWASEQTTRAQMHVPVDAHFVHALPLPQQSGDPAGRAWLWEHNSNPPQNPTAPPGLLLYGRRHPMWIEVIILGAGANVIKMLDNLVLVTSDDLPSKLVVSSPEQGTFEQLLIGGRNHLSTVDRAEQLTYVQLVPPADAPWGGRVRAQYIRVRIEFTGRQPVRLSQLFALLRESVT